MIGAAESLRRRSSKASRKNGSWRIYRDPKYINPATAMIASAGILSARQIITAKVIIAVLDMTLVRRGKIRKSPRLFVTRHRYQLLTSWAISVAQAEPVMPQPGISSKSRITFRPPPIRA